MPVGGLRRSPEDCHSAGLNFPKPGKNRASSLEYKSRFTIQVDRDLLSA
jgi:hypothetical protein